jgi:hypothetical protein
MRPTIPHLILLAAALCLTLPPTNAASEEAKPQPHPLERYRSLWTSPLFLQQAPPEVISPPSPGPPPVYRLLGMGTTPQGIELAYIQSRNGGAIEEVARHSPSGPVLLNVERTPDGNVKAITFRKGGEVVRAVAGAAPSSSGPNPPAAPRPPAPAATSSPADGDLIRMKARLEDRAVRLPK